MNQSQNDKELTEQPQSRQNDGDEDVCDLVESSQSQQDVIDGRKDRESQATTGATIGEIHLGAESRLGCLCFLAFYYIIGIAQLGDIRWETEWWYVPLYAFGPLLWPCVVAWWSGFKFAQVVIALASLWLYLRLLRRLFTPKSSRAFFTALIGLVFLLLLAIGGCFARVSREFEGVC